MSNKTTTVSSTALVTATQTAGTGIALPGSSGLSVMDQITKADIVAIVRNEAEERLATDQQDANRRLHALQRQIPDLEAQIDKIAKDAVANADLKDAKVAALALSKAFGIKVNAEAELARRDDDKKKFFLKVTVSKETGASYERDIAEKEISIPYTDQVIDLVKEIKHLQKDIQAVQIELVAIKQRYAALPALERKAHAELAKATLTTSDAGQALLQRLRGIKSPVTVETIAA